MKIYSKYKIKPVLGVISNNQEEDLLSYPSNNKFWDKVREWQAWVGKFLYMVTRIFIQTTQKKDFLTMEENLNFTEKFIRSKNFNTKCIKKI